MYKHWSEEYLLERNKENLQRMFAYDSSEEILRIAIKSFEDVSEEIIREIWEKARKD